MAKRKKAPADRTHLMKRYKSRTKVDTSRAPDWWLSGPQEVEDYLRSLKGVTVAEVGQSAGGRPIIAASWGEREDAKGRTSTSLASAAAGGSTQAFYGTKRRTRPVFVFAGAAHGTEIEGTAAALNFLNVVVKGKDLRGRRWPRMAAEGRKCRIVVVPFLNIDGRSRFAKRRHFIGVEPDEYRRMSQGTWKTGEKLSWPTSKLHHPVPPDQVVPPLGSYYNDRGYNLVYDFGFTDERQPETEGLVSLLCDEMPDCVLLSHSNNGSLVEAPSSFIPHLFRQRQIQISAVVGSRCQREGMKKFGISTRGETYAGQVFYQTDLVYHCCGALPLLVEFPCGYQNNPDTHDDILDIGMYALEEIVAFGTAYGFRPPEPK